MIKTIDEPILRVLLCVIVGGAFALLFAAPIRAQPSALQEAKKARKYANYEKMVDLLSGVAQDSSVDETYRREALQYLGQAYIAQRKYDKAREAIRRLIQLEPPTVDLSSHRNPPDLMRIYWTVRRQVKGDYTVERDPGLQTLAIMDFSNASVTDSDRWESLTAGFPSMMINYLRGTTDLQVIERQRIKWLLKELELQKKAGTIDQSTAVRTGKVLGATSVLFGNYIVHEDQMRISARLVKVETSEILLAEEVFGDPDEFFELTRDLSKKVTRAINVKRAETPTGTGMETRSFEARIAYYDGLKDLDDNKYRAAYEHFKNALEHDPDYGLAQEKMESVRLQLAATSVDSTNAPGGGL